MSKTGSIITTCPHCGSECKNVRSAQLNPLYREITFRCKNLNCNFMFIAGLEPVRTLIASLQPNPTIQVKPSRRIHSDGVAATQGASS